YLRLHVSLFIVFFFLLPPPPSSTLFPYTTLFRSFRGRWRPAWRRRLAALLASACLFCARPAVAGGEIEFNIPAQPADQALILLRSEEHTSELQSRENLVCRLLLEKKKHMMIARKR